MKKVLLPLLVLTLAGCKTELKTLINVSQLNGDSLSIVSADLNVEVAACNSYEDSRLESRSLQDAKKAVANIIPKAKYVQCYQKKMNSIAHFAVPVVVGKSPDLNRPDPSAFYLFPLPDINQAMMVALPKEMKKQINAYKKRSFMPTLNDFTIEIALKNDTDKTFSYAPMAAYVNDTPVVMTYGDGFKLEKGKSVTIRLSDVSAASALHEGLIATPVLAITGNK